jgi:hypothetical protein
MVPPLVRDVLGMGPIGAVLLGAPVVALAASVVALCSRGALGRAGCVAAASAFGVSLVGAWAAVHGSRERFVESMLHPDLASPTWPSLTLARAIVAEHAGAGTALLLVPLIAAAVAVTWTRGAHGLGSRAFACGLAGAVALPAWMAAHASFVASAAALSVSWQDCDARCRYDAAMASSEALDAVRPWLLVAGTVTAAAAVALVAIRRRPGTARMRVGCLVLGAAGLIAYGCTRALAGDAAHPLPFEETSSWMGGDLDALPTAHSACELIDGVVVYVSKSGVVSVDGAWATDLRAQLDTKRLLWLQIHPGRAFPGTVVLVAPAALPANLPLGVLGVAREAGYPHVLAATAKPVATVLSRTLGPIARPARLCSAPITEGAVVGSDRWSDRVEP